ncbi:alpha/beta hydrolase [Streptomyces sp. NPDC032472]|uniref:alpha/beta fold hydrolase n=1 Tax=Streptomyces sp. NPDC032472 TaxID=3155018 RepID=UPI0033F9422A
MSNTALALTSALALALAAPVAGALGHRAVVRSRNARLLRIDSPNGIDEQRFVPIGGIEQWISIRGEDTANPVMLELHGGPGASHAAHGPRTRAWEEHFTVVRWDMRGTGKTLGRSDAAAQGEISLDRLYEDALEVTRYVRARLGADRVVLVAHSFGSVVGLRLARRHPGLYAAYVGTDQNIHAAGRDDSARAGLLARLRAAGKRKQLAEVEAMGADPRTWTTAQHAAHSRITATTEPLTFRSMRSVVLKSLWFSPLHTLRELGALGRGMKLSEPLLAEAAAFDDWADGTEFDLPFFVFQGEADPFTPPSLARRYVEDVQAPAKAFAEIPDAGHFAALRHPDRFLTLLLTHVTPTLTAGGAAG